MRFTLRQLEIFLAVAREENVSRAAEQLNLSQSATSAALQELEAQSGGPLFDRVRKRLKLNDRGRLVQPHAQALVDQAGELEGLLRNDTALGPLHLGATLTLGNYLATLLIADYLNRQPGAKASLEVGNTARIVERLVAMELDVGLVEGHCAHPELVTEPWGEDVLSVFAAPDHPLAGKAEITPADLAATPWILREKGSGTRDTLERAVADVVPEMTVRLELEHTEAIKRAVESGLGIGCISRLALRDAFRRGSLVPLATPYLDLRRRFHLVMHREKVKTAACRAFLAICQEALAVGLENLGRPVP